jgi:hypothetical protein
MNGSRGGQRPNSNGFDDRRRRCAACSTVLAADNGKALNQELLGRWLGLTQAQVSKLAI